MKPALHPCTCGPNGNCPADCDLRREPKKRAAPEAAIQKAILDRLRWHGVFAAHVPNAGKRSAVTGRRMKAEGLRPGFPDIIAIKHERVAFLEVKAPKGRLSPAQVECHAELLRHGYSVAVVTSADAAVEALIAAGFGISER